MGSIAWGLGLKLVSLIQAILLSVSMHLLPQLGYSISSFIFRVQRDVNSMEKNDKESHLPEATQELISDNEFRAYAAEFKGLDGEAQEEEPVEYLQFKFPGFEELYKIHEKIGENSVDLPEVISADICDEENGGFICKDEENESSEAIEISVETEEKEELFQEREEDQKNQDFLDESQLNPAVNDFSYPFNFERFSSYGSNDLENSCIESSLSDEDFGVDSDNEPLGSSKSASPDKLSSGSSSERDLNDAEVLDSERTGPGDSTMSCAVDEDKFGSLWEHQDLIDQLKTDLRKVRGAGLPTILEECESPKITDDLKPWKIDAKFQREDPIDELHRFYRSYRERMRKFDILNHQNMYALGFLQLKDPFQRKLAAPSLISQVWQNLAPFRNKVQGIDPVKKFVDELECVYVGQMCLSWEILHWQYERVLDLWESDPRGIHLYNEVAGEFQKFQVLVQRFVEDQQFQGPRIQNYVKSRFVLRNFLQVPVLRRDNLRDKKWNSWRKDRDDCVITSDLLVDIVQESIRIFWLFAKSDKDCNYIAINSHKKMPELSNPQDTKLLQIIRKDLQKKGRKLRDILRTENCILRRFHRCRGDDWDQVLTFFCQVDIKLVSRVLNMSKITREQLMWCHDKLERFSFVGRRIRVQPSFLLFPC